MIYEVYRCVGYEQSKPCIDSNKSVKACDVQRSKNVFFFLFLCY